MGYSQKPSFDYKERFTLVDMLKFIRILLSTMMHHDYEIWKMDLKLAFVNGDLEDNIYLM